MVFNPLIKYLILGVLAAVMAAALLIMPSLLRVGMEVDASVPSLTAIRVSLDVTSQRGEETSVNVTRLRLKDETPVVFKVSDTVFEGEVNVAINGKVTLRSVDGSRTYNISMPCMVVRGTNCFRTMNVILGWDAPITIEPGEYILTLKLSWFDASGSGRVGFTLEAVGMRREGISLNSLPCTASIDVAGTRPESTEGWITASGSTRSFAALVSPPVRSSSRCYVTYVWIWFFSEGPGNVSVNVMDPSSGRTLISRDFTLVKVGTYEEILLRLTLPPGTYLLRIHGGSNVFEAGLKCYP